MKWICRQCKKEVGGVHNERKNIVALPCGHSIERGPWKFYDLIEMTFTDDEKDKPLAQLFSVAQEHKEKSPNLIAAALLAERVD